MSNIAQDNDKDQIGTENPETHSAPAESIVTVSKEVVPKNTEIKAEGKKESKWKDPTNILTIVLIVINFFFLILSFWQAKVISEQSETAQQQLSVSRETMERQLRAYLYVKPTIFQQLKDSIRITFEVLNSGQTPAYNVEPVAGHIFLFKDESDIGLDSIVTNYKIPEGSKLVKSNSIVPPGSSGLIMDNMITLSENEMRGLVESKGAAYFLGAIHYKDIFGTQRHVKFRYMLFIHNGTTRLIPDKKGNEEY